MAMSTLTTHSNQPHVWIARELMLAVPQAAAARADLIRRTLEPLAAEVDKVTLLMAALGADSGDQLKDKMA